MECRQNYGVVNPGIVRGKPAYCPDGGPIDRLAPSRNTLMTILSYGKQISLDKNVSFPYTNAAFTAPHLWLCYVRPSHVCTPASFRPLLAETPLPSARTFVSIIIMNTLRFSYKGLSPHKFTPMTGVHKMLKMGAAALCRAP
jgi:hypothetical protein